jgi:hypothetical protein
VIPSCFKRFTIRDLFFASPSIIESNRDLIKYQNVTLFEHQRKLYDFLRDEKPNGALIFYTAPTGSGKTLTPLGIISANFRVIFICASRHIGLALAKSAISMEKRIAIAFGCETADDIRLHYFAADVYTKNAKSGGIHKVDNSYGQNVELMICDATSYVVAMHYMLSFNNTNRLITFWDEPTISMDCTNDDHPLHPILHKNWNENKIPRLILSCATLPEQLEIQPTINDFLLRFPDAIVKTISSFDFKKNIRIVNSDGFPVLPHTLFTNYRDLIQSVQHFNQNPTLLRYIDLKNIVEFIGNQCSPDILNKILNNINVENLTMTAIKSLYLRVLSEFIQPEFIQHKITPLWHYTKNDTNLRKINSESHTGTSNTGNIVRMNSMPLTQKNITYNGCVFLSTADAHTLTDGPSLYLVEDTIKIGRFLFQQSKIPDNIIQNIIKCIDVNNQFQNKISELQKKIEDMRAIQTQKDEIRDTKEIRDILEYIENLQRQFKPIQLTSLYIPNTTAHLQHWCPLYDHQYTPFTSNIADEFIVRIMKLGNQISDEIKILLMMGIGIFCEDLPTTYHEIIKELAYEKQLYLIIASSDYIYGTNYQFCHGFLGRDLINMTPQKIIQAMGRIGRGNIQQNYTVRFRNDDLLYRLFLPLKDGFNIEAIVMNKLFSHSNYNS